MAWQWQILGQPVAKARARVLLGFDGKRHGVTPNRTAAWEAEASVILQMTWRLAPLDELVSLDVVAVFGRTKELLRKKHTDGRLPHGVKPDGDNVLKAVKDALKKAGVLRDDSLVWRATVTKLYAARDEGPRVEVTLRTLDASSAERPEEGTSPPSPGLRLLPPVEDSRG